MGNAVGKNGAIKQAFEYIPGANLVIMGVHVSKGNHTAAHRAFNRGGATTVGLLAGATGGPAAGLAAGSVMMHGIGASKKSPDSAVGTA